MDISSVSLERHLYGGKSISPSEEFRESLKAFLFTQMGEANESWMLTFARAFEENEDLTNIRDSLWQNIITEREHEQQKEARNPILLLQKPKVQKIFVIALFTLLLLIGGKRFILGTSVEPTYQSRILSTNGEAFLLRQSIQYSPTTSEKILEKDTFVTKSGGEEIAFFNGTFVHIAENTSLTVNAITTDPSFSDNGRIELALEEGRIWIYAPPSMPRNASISLVTENLVITPYSGTIDILKDGNTVVIQVHERTAYVLDRKTQQGKTLIAGQKSTHSLVEAPIIERLQSQDASEPWIQESKEATSAYKESRVQEFTEIITKEVGVLPGSPFYSIKQFFEKSTDLQNNPQKKLHNTEKRFFETILLSKKGDQERAQVTLAKGVQALLSLRDTAPELSPFITHLFTYFLKELSFFPNEPQFIEIQNIVRAAETEVFAQDPVFLHRNILGYLWRIQEILAEKKNYVPKNELEKYRALKELLRNTIPQNPEQKRILLQIKIQELRLLNFLFGALFADRDIEWSEGRVIEETIALTEGADDVRYLLWDPQEFPRSENPVRIFVEKIEIYETLQGQKNQTIQLLKEIENTPRSLPLLHEIRKEVNTPLRDTITEKMIEILETESQKALLEIN